MQMVGQTQESLEHANKTFFFFINTKSGNQEGSKLLELSNHPELFDDKIHEEVNLMFIDLFDSQALAEGIDTLMELGGYADERVFVVVCGGDGTISWVINQLDRYFVKLSDLVFGVLPVGTGNDMCRSLGWDGTSFQVTIDKFTEQINMWLQAEIQDYDIWKVTLKTFQDGKIYDIQNRIQRETQGTVFSRLFTNYVGLGLDGRIVYTMERYRTSSTFINRILYTLVGCYNIFRPLKQLHTSISSFYQRRSPDKLASASNSSEGSVSSGTRSIQRQFMPNGLKKIKLKCGYRGLVCLNSTSYMSGVKNIWETNSVADRHVNHSWKPQSSSDGNIQFIAFRSEMNMAMERVVSTAGKVAQGSGPFSINMNRPQQPQATFIQIDGQSIKVVNLRSIEIERAKCGRIKVLVRRQ